MGAPDWSRKVFRLRRLPSRISSTVDAAFAASLALSMPIDQIAVYSVAGTTARWEITPTKVVTLQLKSSPACLGDDVRREEWELVLPGDRGDDEKLILDTHFYGLTVLNDVEPSKHHTDCIAISGLASHAFGSWQRHGPDKSFMWIRDELPRSVPGLRTIIYGYDSTLINSNSFQSISDIALSFIHQLNSAGWNLSSAKPIIFLAHSLGGLVLKAALVQVANQEVGESSILTNTRGAFMFGVPSLGMEQSHIMAMVEGQANDMLVQDLSRNNGSNFLRQLNKSFEGISFTRTAPIYWAYETKESQTVHRRPDGSWDRNGPLAVLVNPDSATCYRNRSQKHLSYTIPINEDHTNLAKFSRGDVNLATILSLCRKMCDVSIPTPRDIGVSPSEYESPEGSIIYTTTESAGVPPIAVRAIDVSENEQLLEDLGYLLSSLEEWLQEGSGLFWIHGKPGSGKSTLMKYLYQSHKTWELLHDWRRSSCEIRAGFFFYYRGTPLQKSFEGVLRSLVAQLLSPHRDAFIESHQAIWSEYQAIKSSEALLLNNSKKIAKHITKVKALLAKVQDTAQSKEISEDERVLMGEPILELENKLTNLGSQQQNNKEELAKCQDILQMRVPILANSFRPHMNSLETEFLKDIINSFRDEKNELIRKLEKILQRLLNQSIKQTDIVLFFDALDEYEGHLAMISRFLKGIVNTSSTSQTRVKVCLSSQPWKELQTHFAAYPNFGVQDYTRSDIELFAANSLVDLHATNPFVMTVLPIILARANGVFLWVRLAIRELSSAIAEAPRQVSQKQLEEKLRELPDDLVNFYDLIVERIPKSNRRYAFALLEVLIRQENVAATAGHIRNAVLISSCSTYAEARDELELVMASSPKKKAASRKQIEADIMTWGGGLVEIRKNCPQLMHQTVFEFATSLTFKETVLGNLAPIVTENGHSYHFKYWTTCLINPESRWPFLKREEPRLSQTEFESRIAFHGERSEVTTGNSHLHFIASIPDDSFHRLLQVKFPHRNNRVARTMFIVSNGLLLCLHDWASLEPDGLKSAIKEYNAQLPQFSEFPLLSNLIFAPPSGMFHKRQATAVRILLEHGYNVAREPQFFETLLKSLWESDCGLFDDVPRLALCNLAQLALDYGQDPNISFAMFVEPKFQCYSLHVAPPCLSAVLIDKGVDVNSCDTEGRTPLDWILDFPQDIAAQCNPGWDCATRFEKWRVWTNALQGFDEEGFDTRGIRRAMELRAGGWKIAWPRLFGNR
ncbi:Protein SERAC1 [Paramyrothecium foliicola]|nr:Protein SERAC1 [Paramyrothecium foliicola]